MIKLLPYPLRGKCKDCIAAYPGPPCPRHSDSESVDQPLPKPKPLDEISRSRAQCMMCFDIIESHHVHDFVRCQCKAIFLDGGLHYVHYGAPELTRAYINLLTEYKGEHD